jgi:hypothetical protein
LSICDLEVTVTRQHLDRDVAVEAPIARAIHLTHPACPERSENLVGSDAGAGSETHTSEVEGPSPIPARTSDGPTWAPDVRLISTAPAYRQ